MEKTHWSSSDVCKLFRLNKSAQALIYAEDKGEIPVADRVYRGSIPMRQWRVDQLPEIGKRFGFLKKPPHQIVMTFYAPKGGVLKTTSAVNFARVLALNGIRVIVIGLEASQQSMTLNILPLGKVESLEELPNIVHNGIFQFYYDKVPIKEIIQKTSLPTLDIIPENHDLSSLDLHLITKNRREYFFKEGLIPELSSYDAIIFDNGASFTRLTENSLAAANCVVSPIACDIESWSAIERAYQLMGQFKDSMKLNWPFIQIATLLERTKLSQQIYASYLNMFSENILTFPIRKSVIGQEARVFNQSVIEYAPTSELAQDYYDIITETWKRIAGKDAVNGN